MSKSLKVLFFGNERIATGISTEPVLLRTLLDSPHEVVGVVIHAKEAKSRTNKSEPIVELAESAGIQVINPENLTDHVQEIKDFGADIGVLVAYGKIVPAEIIDLFEHGIINLHPSALPKLRGSTPIESVILSGENSTAVSIMKLAPKMDAGPLLAQRSVDISAGASKQQLANQLHSEGTKLMLEVLAQISIGDAEEQEQDESNATFCSTIKKSDGHIDWSKSAGQIEREIRAYAGWPTSYFEITDQRYVVISADTSTETISEVPGTVVAGQNTLGVQCGKGVVWITYIQPAGKKEMPVSAFLNGYRSKLED